MTGRRGAGGIRGALLYPCPMDAKAHDLQEIPWRYGRVIRSGRRLQSCAWSTQRHASFNESLTQN